MFGADGRIINAVINAPGSIHDSEWGMRAIQGSMPRLKDALAYEENGERKLILKLVPLLYNLRIARVDLNQIKNTYLPHWSVDANYFISGCTTLKAGSFLSCANLKL